MTAKAVRLYGKPEMTKYQLKFGGVAQLGEHLPCKQGVRSSILLISTIEFHILTFVPWKLNNVLTNTMIDKRDKEEKINFKD